MTDSAGAWPALPYEEWRETRDTLHMYTQVIGKLRLALSPFEPEWANVPLYVTARGLSTSPVPVGIRTMDAEFDFMDHAVVLRSNDGMIERRPLGGSVAEFFTDVQRMLERLSVTVKISPVPSEVSDPIPFPDDRTHETYNPEHATRFFQVLSRVDVALKAYHAAFRGRSTPVHFFWGTFDLAVTRYSGRAVVPPAGAGVIARYSGDAEAICVGWWPGDDRIAYPAFFAYGYPAPDGIDRASIEPAGAAWEPTISEFLLPYDAARTEPDPRLAIRQFLESTYATTAALMKWDAELVHAVGPAAHMIVTTRRDGVSR